MNIVMGFLFVMEGLILFVVVDLICVILSFIIGFVLIGGLVGVFGIKLLVFYGGIFVVFLLSYLIMYLVFIVIGVVVFGVIYGLLRKVFVVVEV